MLKKGQEVLMTAEGIKNGLDGRSNRIAGIVLADERPDGTVYIYRSGDAKGKRRKYSSSYWRLREGQGII